MGHDRVPGEDDGGKDDASHEGSMSQLQANLSDPVNTICPAVILKGDPDQRNSLSPAGQACIVSRTAGRRKWKVLPRPGSDSTQMAPP